MLNESIFFLYLPKDKRNSFNPQYEDSLSFSNTELQFTSNQSSMYTALEGGKKRGKIFSNHVCLGRSGLSLFELKFRSYSLFLWDTISAQGCRCYGGDGFSHMRILERGLCCKKSSLLENVSFFAIVSCKQSVKISNH